MSKFKPSDFIKDEAKYIRVGVDYFKVIYKPDRYNILRKELKKWKKEEIILDYGKKFVENIEKYDDFIIYPNNEKFVTYNIDYYNLYSEFPHTPKKGTFEWSKYMIMHIFGNQSHLGFRYMQALYLHPEKMLPILVLVSKERQTGKTTFINWLMMIFGANMVQINPEDLVSSFNSSYATANIIAVEETLIEKAITVEKLKALATGKTINVNQKFISQYNIPFFGKIILSSNNEDKFARIDEEEIRFLVRKVGIPSQINHNIESDLKKEIPAFLYYLSTLPPIDWSVDRSGFTPAELNNEFLNNVKKESKSGLYKDLKELITEFFMNMNEIKPFLATPTDIKQKWFQFNNRIELQYIRHVLNNEFHIEKYQIMRYLPFNEGLEKRVGAPYVFKPNDFGINQLEVDNANYADVNSVKCKKVDLPF